MRALIASVFPFLFCLLLALGLTVVVSPDGGFRAQESSKVDSIEESIKSLKEEKSEFEADKKKELKRQEAAEKKDDKDEIGKEINSLTKKIAAKQEEIDAKYVELRTAAMDELDSALDAKNYKRAKELVEPLKESIEAFDIPNGPPKLPDNWNNPANPNIRKHLENHLKDIKPVIPKLKSDRERVKASKDAVEKWLKGDHAGKPWDDAKKSLESFKSALETRETTLDDRLEAYEKEVERVEKLLNPKGN